MSMRQFILALGLYTEEEINNNLFGLFCDAYFRNMPNNYNLTDYCIGITTRNHYDSSHPPSYTTIKSLIRHLVHRLLTLSVVGRHNAREKFTLEYLFFLHSMDGGEMVDIPWNLAKFLSDKAKGIVTLGPKTSLLSVAKLVDLGIYRYNRLGLGELVDDQLDNSGDEVAATEARRAQYEAGGVRRHPNMSLTNRLRDMDDRLGDMDTNIYKLSNDVKDLTYVVSGMYEQYDQFYGEFGQMRMEQERFCN
ncbi:hypothetical protein Tco_1397900 [Tanacetum coccineum]